MNTIKKFLSNHKKIMAFLFLIIAVIFFIMPIATRVSVKKGESYEKKNEVALYLFKYKELPNNYRTKIEIKAMYNEGLIGSKQVVKLALMDGYSYGGDKFAGEKTSYKDWIGNYTQNINNLYECDIYENREKLIKATNPNRGTHRLVYTGDCTEIYYSDNHYGEKETPGFKKITKSSINRTSNTLWVVFFLWTSCGAIIIAINIRSEKTERSVLQISQKSQQNDDCN